MEGIVFMKSLILSRLLLFDLGYCHFKETLKSIFVEDNTNASYNTRSISIDLISTT